MQPLKRGWRQSTARYIAERLRLFEWLLDQVQSELGLSVFLDEPSGDARQPGLNWLYVDKLYDQVFRRVAGLSVLPIEPDQFMVTSEGNVALQNELLVIGCDEKQRGRAVSFLLERPGELSEAPKAKATGEAYRNADSTTQRLKTDLALFLQLAGNTPDTRCEECEHWFKLLGVSINE